MDYLNYIFPELFLSISIMTLLMIGVFYKNSLNFVYQSSLIVLLISSIFILFSLINENIFLFNLSYKIDYFSSLMKIITLISTFFVMFSSYSYVKAHEINKIEYPILILSSVLGMIVMISSHDLIIFYIGLELQSLALYVLSSFNRDNIRSSEAGLKYFVLSALSSGLLLYGCSLIYGFTNSTNFDIIAQSLNTFNYGSTFGIVFILVGLAFKISAVPFHMWAPDVYEGSPTSVTSFFSVAPKIAALTVLIKLLYIPFINLINEWQPIIIFISISSMILGAVAAIGQKNIKRLMAYSSIGHMGYILAGISTGLNIGIQNSIVYLIIYVTMNIAMFTCIIMMRRKNIYYENIDELSGLSKNHPLLAVSLLIILFSLSGIPPLAGFFGKFYIFMSVIEAKMYFLAIIGLLTTVISAFYYLRIIKVIYFDEPKESFDTNSSYGVRVSLILTTFFILLYFVYPNMLINLILKINII